MSAGAKSFGCLTIAAAAVPFRDNRACALARRLGQKLPQVGGTIGLNLR
jgi:hypothetical protein